MFRVSLGESLGPAIGRFHDGAAIEVVENGELEMAVSVYLEDRAFDELAQRKGRWFWVVVKEHSL